MDEIIIKTASPQDAPQLLEIYGPYVKNTAITFEYEVPTVAEFTSRIQNTLKKYPYIIALRGTKIVGYAYASPYKGRAAYDWCVELSLYVDKDERGKGIGTKLYTAIEKKLHDMNILNIYSCISVTDTEDEHLTNKSREFHKKFGFSQIASFKQCGFKFSKWYDMIWMEKIIGEKTSNPPAVKKFSETL